MASMHWMTSELSHGSQTISSNATELWIKSKLTLFHPCLKEPIGKAWKSALQILIVKSRVSCRYGPKCDPKGFEAARTCFCDWTKVEVFCSRFFSDLIIRHRVDNILHDLHLRLSRCFPWGLMLPRWEITKDALLRDFCLVILDPRVLLVGQPWWSWKQVSLQQ